MEQKWLLIDMHLHSQYSKLKDNARVKTMSAEEYVNVLKEKNVEVFSITDHNFFSDVYYDEIDKYIVENDLKMKLINGAELDVSVSLSNGTSDIIHLCFYFDLVDRKKLSECIMSLYVNESGVQVTPTFVELLTKFSELNCKFIVIPHGNKNRGLFKIFNELSASESIDFYKYAMYKIFNAFDVSSSFFSTDHNMWAARFYEQSKKYNDILDKMTPEEINVMESNIVGKIKGKNVTLSNEEYDIYEYVINYGSLFSYFSFSDWHNAEPYDPKINNFIFGSLDLAFESFEMATLDPVSRIELSKDSLIEIPPTILKKVEFDLNGVHKIVEFSPGLNAIVGKRGSGKSLLLSVIKNLVDKNDENGALNKYKSLKVSNISAKNRGNINISLGSFNSVSFLTQDEIKDIFEKPDLAQENIAKYFIDIKECDTSKINEIIKIGKDIKQYNQNYKNLTSNILAMKKLGEYNFNIFDKLDYSGIKSNFSMILNAFNDIIESLDDMHFNTEEIICEKNKINNLKDYYLKMIDCYNSIFTSHNFRIMEINSDKSSNQITNRQNFLDIQNAVNQIKENFSIQLSYEKTKYLLENFSMKSPDVEIFRKGKYLFVTYYKIPDDIKDQINMRFFSSISYATKMDDVYDYIIGNKNLKVNFSNVTDGLTKFLKEDIFKVKKEFYEIKDFSFEYNEIIENVYDLEHCVSERQIINLTFASPGMKSVAYLDMLFDLEDTVLILDQPEDNIDNDYISRCLVPNIKNKKKIKQLIFVTHNPSVAVYGDAFNYIYVENKDGGINYTNYLIEKKVDKEKLMNILEGGRYSFSNRNKKFGNILGDEEYGIKKE